MSMRDPKAPRTLDIARDSLSNMVTKFQDEAINNVANMQKISRQKAKELLANDEEFNKLMNIKDKQIRMHLADVMYPKFIEAAEKKMDSGSLEQAKHAMTAASIVKDKAMGTDKYSAKANVIPFRGNNQINIGFQFSAYDTPVKKRTIK